MPIHVKSVFNSSTTQRINIHMYMRNDITMLFSLKIYPYRLTPFIVNPHNGVIITVSIEVFIVEGCGRYLNKPSHRVVAVRKPRAASRICRSEQSAAGYIAVVVGNHAVVIRLASQRAENSRGCNCIVRKAANNGSIGTTIIMRWLKSIRK